MNTSDNEWGVDIHSLTNIRLEEDEIVLQEVIVPADRFGGGINFDEFYIAYTDMGAFIYEVIEFTEDFSILVARLGQIL